MKRTESEKIVNVDSKQVLKEEDLIKDLKEIGIREGDHVALGISFKSLGAIEGGPKAFLSALMKVLGVSGTIMIPAYTHLFHLDLINRGRVNYVFDYQATPVTTGVVAETLRTMDGAVRSRHPTNSIVAYGKMADFLTEGHDENSPAYSPYSLLARMGGKILCVGIGDKIVGLRHEAQYLAGLLSVVPFKVGVKYKDRSGEIKVFIREDKGGCVKRLPELVNDLRERGIVKAGKIGKASSVLMPVRESLYIMTKILKEHPERNLCDDISCLWCREIERRLDLFGKIEYPKYFQKSRIFIYGLALFNRIRLDYPGFSSKISNLFRLVLDKTGVKMK